VVPIEGASELGPDRFGGLLAWNGEGVTRFGGPSGAAPWHYVSGTGVGSIAQGGDGSVSIVNPADGTVVIVDGSPARSGSGGRWRRGTRPRSTSAVTRCAGHRVRSTTRTCPRRSARSPWVATALLDSVRSGSR
jgi:hypothetical protein